MELEIVSYLLKYYSALLPRREQLAYKHLLHDEKLAANDDAASREKMRAILLRQGWLSDDPEVLALLHDGVLAFRTRVAQRLITENSDEVVVNTCPTCGRVARTPLARQCRHCGYNWH